MRFRDLYSLVADSVSKPHVRFGLVRDLVNNHHKGVGEITIRAISYPVPNLQAHYVLLGTDRTSPYGEEFDLAEIRYCDGLDENPHALRFALTKELMHVFDTEEERTSTRQRFIELMREIQNVPLSEHASPRYRSEIATKWMAAIILCPHKIREPILMEYRAGKLSDAEVATLLKVPRSVVPDIMDDYYERAFESLMQK